MPLRHVRLTKLLDELQVQRRHLAHDRFGVVENRRVADDGNQADADDAVQDTYLRYCSYDKEFTDEDHIRAWLLRVAINRARDQKRSFWEKHRVSWEDYMETLSFEAPEDKSLFEAVMSLPAKYRTVIHLFYYEDYSVARIAEILHSREGTVKSQLNRGRQLLKTKLMEAWNDDE